VYELLASNELSYEVLDSIYNPKLAEGTIIDQDPQATVVSQLFVKEGRIIRLRVSKRSRLVEVPSLIDKSQRFAESILKNRGFKYTVTFRNTSEANGAVLNQLFNGVKIKEGTKIAIGSIIAIVVGRNEGGLPIPIPDLYGLTIFEARERLAAIPGMNYFPVCDDCKTSEDSLAARINSQTPEFIEGIMIPAGSTITVNAVLNFVNERALVPQ
jgi:beta-lactam-binding protein with PASTA domain